LNGESSQPWAAKIGPSRNGFQSIATLQADNPVKDKEANWLPAPRGPFLVILGTYAPGEAMIETLSNPNAYIPPPAVVVQ
jgi:hypothetical protein